MPIQIKAHNDDVSSVKMTSEKVEPLFFPILFPLVEDGWTNDLKDCITAEEYVMWRLLMPEKYKCAGHAMQYLQIWRACIHSRCDSHPTISMNRKTLFSMNSFRCIKRDLFLKTTNARSVLCDLKQ
jgi:hypothetical protein